MPVYNPNIEWLNLAINSVIDQSYNNWELCMADDCSTNANVRNILESYSKKYPNIKPKSITEYSGQINLVIYLKIKLTFL